MKSKLNGTLLTVITILVGLITTGMGYLIRQNDKRTNAIEETQRLMILDDVKRDKKIEDVIWAQLNDPDTKQELKELLMSHYISTSGAVKTQ